jgi:hypothetical protein
MQAGGAALGALGSSGKQGGLKTTQLSTSTQNINQFNEAVEPDYFSNFRQGLIPMFMQQLQKAMGEPVYGDAQKASYLQDLNSSYAGNEAALKSSMARSGRLDSGTFDSALGDLGMSMAGQKSQFFSDLPFKEREAQFARTLPLLQLGAGWSGNAPVSQRITGTNVTTGNMSGNTVQEGPSFGRSFASGLGGLMANGAFNLGSYNMNPGGMGQGPGAMQAGLNAGPGVWNLPAPKWSAPKVGPSPYSQYV